ncbi:hypothetical protein ACC794_37760, partial [Rhizobium ruizarguesonis]
ERLGRLDLQLAGAGLAVEEKRLLVEIAARRVLFCLRFFRVIHRRLRARLLSSLPTSIGYGRQYGNGGVGEFLSGQ